MSYGSLAKQNVDPALRERVDAAVQKEARANQTLRETDYGRAVIGGAAAPWVWFSWPVSVATEAAYEYALNADNPNPGGDPTVITDADILSVIQTFWPPNPWPPPPPLPPPPV